MVKKLSRFQVAKVIGLYKAGRYREVPHLVTSYRGKKVRILCEKPSEINLDGELLMEQDATFEVVPKGIRFFYPKGLTY